MRNIDLLDDSEGNIPTEHAWEALTRTKCAASQPKPKAPEASTPAPAARPQSKVFSSSPTLRQMMREYNKRTATTPLIRQSDFRSTHFDFDQVDLIELPSIPGRILRPAPSR